MVGRLLSLNLFVLFTAGLAHGAPLPSRLPAQLTEVLHCKSSRMLLCDELYPIGFSKSGKLAYIHIPADEAVGEYLWAFRIVDLVTDAKVEALDWQTARSEKIQGLATLLQHKRSDFEALLARHGIEPLAKPRLQPFPIRYRGIAIAASLANEVQPVNDETTGYSVVTHVVELRDAKGRSKKIGKLTSVTDAGMPMTYPPKLLGYLRSPLESRAVVVLEQTHRGYEGPPDVSSFVLMGAHLRLGFKQRRVSGSAP